MISVLTCACGALWSWGGGDYVNPIVAVLIITKSQI
jgi:hypothetical protein